MRPSQFTARANRVQRLAPDRVSSRTLTSKLHLPSNLTGGRSKSELTSAGSSKQTEGLEEEYKIKAGLRVGVLRNGLGLVLGMQFKV